MFSTSLLFPPTVVQNQVGPTTFGLDSRLSQTLKLIGIQLTNFEDETCRRMD
jgi:hypothetical protein